MKAKNKLSTQVRCTLKPTLMVLAVMWFGNCSKNSKPEARKDGDSSATVVASNTAWEKVVAGLNFPEGPAWDESGRCLYFSNCYGGWITKLANARADTFLTARSSPFTFDKTNGMTFRNGYLFACDFGVGAILKISPEGQTEIHANGFEGNAFNRPNDLAFDASGNLYFTDPKSYSREVLDGRIFCLRARERAMIKLADSLGFPNGIALSGDGKKLYVCESAFERVLRFDVLPDGRLGRKEVFVHLPGGDPDGIDFDREGNLYIAHFGGGAVYGVAPDGSIRQKIAAPGMKPTNIEFGGEDLKTLFLTEVETNALYKRRVDIGGVKL